MSTLIEVILPVFLVLGFGYLARWRGLITDTGVDGLMTFAQGFAVPCLLFRAIATMELGQNFDLALLGSFYTGATIGFIAGLFGARFLFKRGWEDSVAVGFCCLFSNSILLGLPITERAYGVTALDSNYAIVAIYAPFCYLLGIGTMEIVKNQGGGIAKTFLNILRSLIKNPLVIGIALGFITNLTGIAIPGVLNDALNLMIQAAIPAALFGLGGILYRYRPEGDLRIVAYIAGVSLLLHPAITWAVGRASGLTTEQFRSAVLTATMAPGMNSYLFANMYGVAKRVAASSVLIVTATSILTIWLWLSILP